MKIKLDENLPLQVKAGLTAFGHDVHTTHEEKLTGSNDSQIWAAAQNERRF
jgi:predicted nuclease of predicted toxin-antitoxin system